MRFKPEIGPATLGDLETIVEFNRRLADESEQKTLCVNTLRSGVRTLLADPRLGRYFLAFDGEKVIGQLMLTSEWSDWRNSEFWWIQSVYVRPDYRRRGVYRALHEHVGELARASPKVAGLRLYVTESNGRARQTYAKLGMHGTGYLVLEQPTAELDST